MYTYLIAVRIFNFTYSKSVYIFIFILKIKKPKISSDWQFNLKAETSINERRSAA